MTTFSAYLDEGSEQLAVVVEYYIEGYSDPETGEYFGETSWTVQLTDLDSGQTGSQGSYASEGDSVYLGFELWSGPAPQRFAIDFNAQNTFSAVSDSLDLQLFNASGITQGVEIVGTAGQDLIVGGTVGDTLDGGLDADYLYGAAGADLLSGGEGADTLVGGAGADTVRGGGGDDVYRLDDTRDTVVELAGEGTDLVIAGVSLRLAGDIENLFLQGLAAIDGAGNALDNRIDGNGAANRLDGRGGDDSLRGGGGDDTLLGGRGHDTLDGGAGTDTLTGGAGRDTYLISAGDQVVEAAGEGFDTVRALGFGEYTLPEHVEAFVAVQIPGVYPVPDAQLTGNAGHNRITAGAGNDSLSGGFGDDTLEGGAGSDFFRADAGADRLSGGDGVDTVSYAESTLPIGVGLGGAAGTGGDAAGDRLVGIEHLDGTGFDDTIGGSAADNRLSGGGGSDAIDGAGGDDTLEGGLGADTLSGGAGQDVLVYGSSVTGALQIDLAANTVTGGDGEADLISGFEGAIGGDGADAIQGSARSNFLAGGAGDDTLTGMAGDDTLRGGEGADQLAGGEGFDLLSYTGSLGGVVVTLESGASQSAAGGDAAGDVVSGFEGVSGGAGADSLVGGAASNLLAGARGADTLRGGAGDDTLNGGPGADSLDGGDGTDTITYAGSSRAVMVDLAAQQSYFGDGEGDVLSGFENAAGGLGGDYLLGSDGANRLHGGAGGDVLDGGAGDDTLTGGSDGDSFVIVGTFGHDVIGDFGGTDVIVSGLGPAFDTAEEILAVAIEDGADTLFDFGAAGTLRVLNTGLDAFSADSFLF